MDRRSSLPQSASSSHLRQPEASSAREPPERSAESYTGKRKADGAFEAPDKRRRVQPAHIPPPVAGLPAHIWQNVFLYLPPLSLGRLLLVNRAFHTLLTRVDDEPDRGSHHISPSLRLVSSETIWSSARKAYFPTIPRPLVGHSELSMWRLLKGRRCQFCARISRFEPHPASTWEGGPGGDGIRVVWPFAVRTCGRCLEERSQPVCCLVSLFPWIDL